MQKLKQIHYGWVIVFACFIMAFTTITALVNCLGIFIKPVSEDLGFTRAAFALYYTCVSMATMAFSPKMGSILQKYNYKLVILICSFGSAFSLFAFSRCTGLWQFRAVGVICGIFTSGLTTMSVSCIINRWFVKKKATALSIAFSGSSMGSMVFNPLVSSVIENHSWNSAYILLGTLILAVNVPVSLLLLKNSPADMGLKPYGADEEAEKNITPGGRSITRSEALRMPFFWMFCLCCMTFGMMGSGIMQHINSYLTDLGYTPAHAASVVVVAMGVATAAKLFFGLVFDRFGSWISTAIICLFMTLAAVLLLFAANPNILYVFSAAYGVAFSIISIPAPNLTADLFGAGDYGRIYGVVVMFLSGGMSIGAPIAAALYDATGSYRPAWMLIVALSLVAIALIYGAVNGVRRYKLLHTGEAYVVR